MKSILQRLLVGSSAVRAASFQHSQVRTFDTTYDYIIIGGGTAGLTLASRLSSDTTSEVTFLEYYYLGSDQRTDTVLVLEAGMPDNYEASVMIPRFYPGASGFAPGTRYDWNLTSSPQQTLQGQAINLTQGHAIGGSSTVNAMIFDRGMPSNYDAWAALGNDGWDFAGLLPYFKKSESFTPAPLEHAALYGLTHDPACHGFSGPVESSYLAWSHPNNTNFLAAMQGLGISTPIDQGCDPLGAYLTTHSIDPRNQSRSSARTSHFDEIVGRANLQIFGGYIATKLLFDKSGGKAKATGVEFIAGPGSPTQRVVAIKEVMVSAGALNTPKLLQLSGIGPESLLSQFGIDVVVDLPGVGSNLQDHPFGLTLASLSDGIPGNIDLDNATFDAEQRALYYSDRKGRWTDTIAEALAFIPLTNFTTEAVANDLLSTINSNASTFLLPDSDQTVIAGYKKQVEQILQMHQDRSTAGMELLFVDGGRSVVNILMHPLSRGTVSITSSDPLSHPAIDPRYFSHPYDGRALVESLRFNRKLLSSGPIQALGAVETLPGEQTTSDTDILNFIKGVTSTEFHYAGTCAMLPRGLGGVVDPELKVYGIEGLRVVDASIMPLLPSAHTQATVYAIAEKASDIILQRNI